MSLHCYKNRCNGTLTRSNPDSGGLYECDECGAGINQEPVEELAGGDGPVAQLATTLLQNNE